eukprot:Nitzschia sp. Nitz4//scaffold3_size479765//114419//115153//NITZ4_000048-RA/size479765-augustus-gene-0.11-mRNA-1//1//CDS//3329550602//5216//frame0
MVATRRRVTRSKTEKYVVGDKVEVVRMDGVDVGILLSRDSDDEDSSSRQGETSYWVVSVDGSLEEEVISENFLGRVLEPNDSDGSTVEKTKPVARKATKTKRKHSKKGRRVNTRATKKDGDELVTTGESLDFERRPAPRPRKMEATETVVEVPLLTGTLFIYRGRHRRVEFVPTV